MDMDGEAGIGLERYRRSQDDRSASIRGRAVR